MRLPVVSRSAICDELPPRPAGFAPGALTDAQGRAYTYLRLSVTDRCDLGCVYCMPPSGEEDHGLRKELLTFEESARLVRVFSEQGIRRVRFTGGEPLVRKDMVDLVGLVRDASPQVESLVMTTNATRLGTLAEPLVRAGLRGVNISIDSLKPERFAAITRGGDLRKVLAGIDAARDAGLTIKLNIVALRGKNDDELYDLVSFAWRIGAIPRFIELMPLGEAANLPADTLMTARDIQAVLLQSHGQNLSRPIERDAHRGPASYLANPSGQRVGFITAMSDEFCGSCNRVRVTARGEVRACLASRRAISLRDVMRGGGDDDDLAWAIHWALSAKARGHDFLNPRETEHQNVGMSLIGG